MKPAELQAKLKTLKLGGMMLTLEVRRVQGEAENVLLVGDSGTGKTMIAIGLGSPRASRGRSIRPTTVAALVSELLEARDERTLSRAVGRWSRFSEWTTVFSAGGAR